MRLPDQVSTDSWIHYADLIKKMFIKRSSGDEEAAPEMATTMGLETFEQNS